MKRILLSCMVIISITTFLQAQTQPKNIIIFVANGLGYNHINAMELYSGNSSMLQAFPVKYGITTYPAYSAPITLPKVVENYKGDYHVRRVWTEFDYSNNMMTDPASSGTAIATGIKSAYKAVGVDLDSSSLETILERAQVLGKSTGIITDLPLSQSGVASFAAHNPTIDNSTEIFTQLLSSKLSLMIGCGNPHYTNDGVLRTTSDYSFISQNDWDSLLLGKTIFNGGALAKDIDDDGIIDNWSLFQNESEFDSITKRLLIVPQVFDGLQFKRTLPDNIASVPDFAELIHKGLVHLVQNQDGFVVVIETGAIDYASSLQNSENTLEALSVFETTYQTIDTWIQQNSTYDETLFIVAGGYETGYLTGISFNKDEKAPDYFTKSIHVTEGQTGQIPEMQFNGTTPTNHVTPLFAKGTGSELFADYIDEEDFVYGPYINNTEIGQLCFRLMPLPIPTKTPKNIILMINDGCGLNQIRAANYYTGKTQAYQNFPISLYQSTYPLSSTETPSALNSWNNSYESSLAWTNGMYLRNRNNGTCSGAAATAIASGTKTYYYALGFDVHSNALNSIARYAKSIGKSMGVASNIPISDATPAVFLANNASRNNAAQITRQMIIESNADLIIGGGHPEYDNHGLLKTTPNYLTIGGEEFWNDLIAGNTIFRTPTNSGWTEVQDIDNDGTPDPWTIIQDSVDFAQLIIGTTPKRLLGLAKVENSMQFYRTGINVQEVHSDDLNANMPELWQIGRVALNALSKNPNGFFVMIEGDAGDNAGHLGYKGRLIEEQIRFNTAVDSVISWIEQNGGWDENLLIVTSDHETGLLCHPDFNTDSLMLTHYDIVDNGVGQIPGMTFFGTVHSNQLVPIYAKGAGAEIINLYADEQDYVRGKFLNNSEIGQAMFNLWGGHHSAVINNKPMFVSKIPNVQVYVGQDTSFTISSDFIQDVEDTEFIFTVITRPKGFTFDATTMTFSGTPESEGNYTVRLMVTDGKTTGAGISVEATFIISILSSTNIKEIAATSVHAYPNPATTKIIVSIPANKGEITLFTASGNIIEKRTISQNQETFDVSKFPSGIYTIEINDYKTITKKVIVVK